MNELVIRKAPPASPVCAGERDIWVFVFVFGYVFAYLRYDKCVKRDLHISKETYDFEEPTNRSHLIVATPYTPPVSPVCEGERAIRASCNRSLLQKCLIKETVFCKRDL